MGAFLSTAFDEIYSRHAPAVFRYLRRLTNSSAKAEDLLQDTFLRFHLQGRSGAALDNARAWLFRVATNLARDRAKIDARAGVREQAYAAGGAVIDFQQHAERRQQVRRVLAGLPVRMRQVLLLHAEGFTYREIAEISGIEPGYVGVLLQRARAEFRRNYGEGHEHGSRRADGVR
jgi:RNA polymerase sigma factor (sigma-70 family)